MQSQWKCLSCAAIAVVALVTACGQQSNETPTSTVTVTASDESSSATTATDTPSSSTTASPTLDEPFQATLVPVTESRGSTTINVQLPQVTGGDAAVRDRFNSGMRTALDQVVGPDSDTTVEDGALDGDAVSQVTTITPGVIAGVAIFNWYAQGAAHPNNSVATITIAVETAQPVLLSEVFVDQQAAADRLASAVTQLDPRVDPLGPTTIDTFLNWVPTSDGFRVFVPVIHAMGDYLPVTVPWDQISDLMTPDMRTVLVQ